jgi:DNA gyrase subunit A
MLYTMESSRPDLSQASPDIIAYIEALEAEVARLRLAVADPGEPPESGEETQATIPDSQPPDEPPTTNNVITVSTDGLVKRTPRHLYSRQHRGGMGIFDLETPQSDPPAQLLIADESQTLIVLTNQGRAFRVPVNAWPAATLRSRGQSLATLIGLEAGELPIVIVPDQGRGYLALVTVTGYVRIWPYYIVGEQLRSGVALYKVENFGPPAAVCWTPGNSDLFIATCHGSAIRFSEKLVPGPGTQGIRLDEGDAAASIASVQPTDGVFLLGADGRGTIRTMAGFSPNKAPGAGGKLAMKTDLLVGVVTVPAAGAADVFILSRLSKVIRFRADEIPPKEGVVQGVNCMALRADQTVAVCINTLF